MGGVPAQRTGPGGAGSDRSGGAAPSPADDDRPGHDRAPDPAGPAAVPGAAPQAGGAASRVAPGGWPTARPRTAPPAGPHAPWTAHPGAMPGHAPTAPWAAPVQGGPVQRGPVQGGPLRGGPVPGVPVQGGPRAAAPVPVVYPPGHAASGTPAGRWDALRDRLSAARLPDGGLRGAVPHRAAAIAVAATLVLAAGVVVAAYVGSESTGDPGTPQGSGTGAAPVAAPADLVAGTTAADPAAFGSPASFTSPTGNISCRITGGAGDGAVRCDVTARTWSAGDCPDAALVTGGPAGARTECGGAPVGSGAAVLDYGTHLTEGDVTCVSSRTGVECRDARTGAGFTAARAAFRLY